MSLDEVKPLSLCKANIHGVTGLSLPPGRTAAAGWAPINRIKGGVWPGNCMAERFSEGRTRVLYVYTLLIATNTVYVDDLGIRLLCVDIDL